ncbi:oxidoreductase [Pseudonocardia sp. KRD-184]|uniref:Oxidoreductase n=1 Tax=Pseudonocardia oceani TaxID=2792013 RepID=A0ABS6U979_9PSEU|nr:PDR/VanB family oxidoreductase [Pseudonocardia oceani]MBW0088668.1 oxidoreductase [Pseudonocardia oceani]MBW0095512.1 oxidoreductase [Pseudonocardia oceani]MBW0108507.1 oxidoreductase [Pseudonocardia oceani]MBW0121523.1 oxidoreductase [Pseudonocardia oceani]MBW0128704.1 oxidoreductase [Pseudonocardia oceani]
MSGVQADVVTLRVAAKEVVSDGVVVLTLRHPDGARLPDWAPGAHVDLILPTGAVRQYSLCGDRFDAFRYRVGVLREPDGRGGSAYVHDVLAVGDTVGVGGPRNHFPLVPSERYLFVAGGIGITPLLPMVRQADALGVDWTLVYGGRTRTSMAFLDELAAHGDRVHVVPEDEHGRIDLPRWLADPQPDVAVYCCGPGPLLDAVERACAHWRPHALRTERFVAEEQSAPVRDEPFEVELARTGRSVTVTPGRTVLEAVRSVGVDVLSSCRHGTCGTCETDVLDGLPDHRDSILDGADRAANDCMFVCVSRSRTDRLVLDL